MSRVIYRTHTYGRMVLCGRTYCTAAARHSLPVVSASLVCLVLRTSPRDWITCVNSWHKTHEGNRDQPSRDATPTTAQTPSAHLSPLMGSGASVPANEEEALAAGFTAEQIVEYKTNSAEKLAAAPSMAALPDDGTVRNAIDAP